MQFYLDAFHDLSTCRPGGMDLLPIPFTEIVKYSTLYDVGDFDCFKRVIMRMDNALMKLHQEEQKKKEKNGGHNKDTGSKG